MDSGLSHKPLFDDGEGEVDTSPSYSYGDIFEKACAWYMSVGMSYEDYWDGDCCMVVYYRRAEEMRRKRENQSQWRQGAYIYDVISRLAPIFGHTTKSKPEPYVESPYPMTDEEAREIEERKEREAYERIMLNMKARVGVPVRKE